MEQYDVLIVGGGDGGRRARGQAAIFTIRSMLRGMQNGSRAEALYAGYPADESGYDAWVLRAVTFWKSCGSMAENQKSV